MFTMYILYSLSIHKYIRVLKIKISMYRFLKYKFVLINISLVKIIKKFSLARKIIYSFQLRDKRNKLLNKDLTIVTEGPYNLSRLAEILELRKGLIAL